MKGSEFIKILRKVIREEVRTVVQEELKPYKPLLSEKREKPSPNYNVAKVAQKPKRTTPLVTIDGAIGDILRETAESMQRSGYEDWPEMGNTMTSDLLIDSNANGFEAPVSQQAPIRSMEMMNGDPTAMFMKDYRSIMKAADEQAQNYR